MIVLTNNMQNAVTAQSTLPGYLVEVVFPTLTKRWCSVAPVNWNSYTWEETDLEVAGLGMDAAASAQGQLRLGISNDDPEAITVLALNSTSYGFANRPIKVWYYDHSLVSGGVLTESPIQLFSGVGDSVVINPLSIVVTLVNPGVRTSFLPRVRISEANGFTMLQARGLKITWNNEIFTLE